MPDDRHLPPGRVITYPNREKATSKATKLIVVLILLASIVLILAVTFGGWNKLQGLSWVDFAWCAVYLIMAVLITRWARGLLPIAAAFAILMLIIALIAGLGGSGTSWFQRNHAHYAATQSIFGGSGLDPDTLGVLVLLIAPVQALLIVFAMIAFAQGWNVELEKDESELKRPRRRGGATPSPAPSS